jgi:membrane protein required for colicin V production
MINNWLDIVILVILVVSFILGLVKGLLRMVIGIAAAIAGLVIAAIYYRPFSHVFSRLFAAEVWAQLIAFVVIFVAVLIVGGLISFLLSKVVKGPLRFLDRVLGGALGLVEGIFICGVLVIAQLAFPVNKQALMRSSLAPYCYWLTKGMVQVVPQELKEKFKATYKEIVGAPKESDEKI